MLVTIVVHIDPHSPDRMNNNVLMTNFIQARPTNALNVFVSESNKLMDKKLNAKLQIWEEVR